MSITAMPRFARQAEKILESPIDATTSMLQKIDHDVINFALGSPAANMIPVSLFASLGNQVLNDAASYSYAPTEGDAILTSALLNFLQGNGRSVDPESIVITAGGMQGLDVMCKLFIDPGDTIIVESPTYPSAFMTAIGYGGNIVEIPIDDEGIKVGSIADYVRRTGDTPKMIYVVPTYQNPTGRTLSLQRRHELVALARELDCMVIEDDPYGLIGFDDKHIPSIRDVSNADPHVVTVRTFSKIMAPGFRVGWLEVDPAFVSKINAARQCMDTCANTLSQRIVAQYLNSGGIQEHLKRISGEYALRKDTLRAALRTRFGEMVQVSNPSGGFFLWVTFSEGTDSQLLFRHGIDHGVAIVPGDAFSPSGKSRNCARLCFAALEPEDIETGIARLAQAYEEITSTNHEMTIS